MFHTHTEHAIVLCLGEKKDLSIQELYECVTQKSIKLSLPNFYKIIGRMIDSQMLVKTKGKLQLHAMYMHYIIGLADKVKSTYFTDTDHKIKELEKGEHQTFNSTSFYELDVIWMDILSQLIKKHPGEEGFYYNSHPYHVLSITEKEKANLEAVGQDLKRSYFLFGNNTFLDNYGSELLSMQGYIIKCVDEAPFPEEGYMVNIIGDYIIECVLPQTITQHYKIFFDTVKSLDDFNVPMFSNIMRMKVPCSIKLIYSPEHANKMRAKIKKCF